MNTAVKLWNLLTREKKKEIVIYQGKTNHTIIYGDM